MLNLKNFFFALLCLTSLTNQSLISRDCSAFGKPRKLSEDELLAKLKLATRTNKQYANARAQLTKLEEKFRVLKAAFTQQSNPNLYQDIISFKTEVFLAHTRCKFAITKMLKAAKEAKYPKEAKYLDEIKELLILTVNRLKTSFDHLVASVSILETVVTQPDIQLFVLGLHARLFQYHQDIWREVYDKATAQTRKQTLLLALENLYSNIYRSLPSRTSNKTQENLNGYESDFLLNILPEDFAAVQPLLTD